MDNFAREALQSPFSFTLPDQLIGGAPAPGRAYLFPHTARAANQRLMISLSTHALSFVHSGRKRLHSGPSAVDIDEGGVTLFAAGNCLSTDCPIGESYQSLLLFFDDTFVDRLLAKHGVSHSEEGNQRYVTFASSAELAALCRNTRQMLIDFPNLSPERCALRVEEILLVVVQTMGVAALAPFRRGAAEPAISRVRRIFEAHWQEHLSISELAFLAHMGASTFKRHFKEAYGVPPRQKIIERKLAYAAHLLRVERKRPAEIYEDVGFSSASAFSQAFKSHFGLTPSDYRVE